MGSFINIFTDGGARGNPGNAAIGVYITDSENKKVSGFGKKIGISTNNVAEYKAVLEALDFVVGNKEKLQSQNLAKVGTVLSQAEDQKNLSPRAK